MVTFDFGFVFDGADAVAIANCVSSGVWAWLCVGCFLQGNMFLHVVGSYML